MTHKELLEAQRLMDRMTAGETLPPEDMLVVTRAWVWAWNGWRELEILQMRTAEKQREAEDIVDTYAKKHEALRILASRVEASRQDCKEALRRFEAFQNGGAWVAMMRATAEFVEN